MENNQNELSQAELYREERKKRMAKVSNKNAKKSPQAEKIGRIFGKTISVIVIVALALAVLYGTLNFFGVPQKILSVTKVGDEKVSIAKYNYYYMDIYNNMYNTSYQYDNYYGTGYGALYTGFDYTKSPMEQKYTLGTVKGYEDVENVTWADYFRVNALEYVQSYIAYADLARKEGIELTDEQKTQIEEEITEATKTAEENDYSLNRYLIKLYGKGINEKLLREVYEERFLAYNYATAKQEQYANSITDDQINQEFTDNKEDYTTFSISLFKVAAKTPTLADDATDEEKAAANQAALDEAKTTADALFAKITDEASLVSSAKGYDSSLKDTSIKYTDTTASTITSSFGEDVSKWAYDSARAVSDKAVIKVDGGYVIAYLTGLPKKDTSKPVDVRHILVQFPSSTDSSGKTVELSDSEKATYYAKAKSIYDEYLANPTQDNFAALATTYSEDTGSKEKGGLYEDVEQGAMTEKFNDWIFDAARKPGDTDIIETSYGYHVMYFVSNDNPETWYTSVKTAIGNGLFSEYDKGILEGEEYALSNREFAINWASSALEDIIVQRYISQ